MGRLVGAWMLGWSVLLVIGYVAELTPWPGLRVLRSPAATKLLVMSSTAVVGGFSLAGTTTDGDALGATLSLEVK